MKLALPSVPHGGMRRPGRCLSTRLLNHLVVGGGSTGLQDWMRQEVEVMNREQGGAA